jgi:branched-chain amino acid transport system substrate-binding protein
VGLALLVVASACSSSGNSSTSKASSASASPKASQSAAAAAASAALDKTAAAYVGGKVGKATGSPVEIGWVNTDTGPASFPLATSAAEAAVAYANANLNGVNGHVIKLVTCSVATEEDGTSCGTQFRNDPNMHAVIEGVLVAGSDTFFKVINNTKAVIQLAANSPADIDPYAAVKHPNVFTLNAGAFGGYNALIQYAAKYAKPAVKSMLLIGDDNPAVKLGIQEFAGELAQYHIATKTAYIVAGSGASTVASDIQGAGGNTINTWFIFADEATCASIFGYQQTAGIHPLTMGQECIGAEFKPLTGGNYAPNGLIFNDFGWNVFLPGEHPLQQVIDAEVAKAIPNNPDPDTASTSFTDVLNMVRAMNAAGGNPTTQGIATAIRAMKAPIAGTLGGLDCGTNPFFPTICGNQVGLVQAKGKGFARLAPSALIPAFTV